jgi:hypothetical protein
MAFGLLSVRGDATLLVLLAITILLAVAVCIWPRHKPGPSPVESSNVMSVQHALLWDKAAGVLQETWLHSADDYCLWVAIRDNVLHIERLPGDAFIDRVPGQPLKLTLITSFQDKTEVLAHDMVAPVNKDRDTEHSNLFALLDLSEDIGMRMNIYEVRKLRTQLQTAQIFS